MRRSREDASETRRAIVEAASRLIREKGIASASIADVMSSLGLTVGGFYRHFKDKEALVSEAIDAASLRTVSAMKQMSEGTKGPARLRRVVDGYLSREHLLHPGRGCPIAALASEAWHETQAVREALQRAAGRMLAMLESGEIHTKRERGQMLLALSTAVGAVVLGRILEGTETGEELVKAVRVKLLGTRQ